MSDAAIPWRTVAEAAAKTLVSERFLLPEDAQRLIAEARQRDLGF